MNLKKKIEKLWVVNKTIALLDKVFAYNEYLGCFLMITFFCIIYVLMFPIMLVTLPIIGLANLFKKLAKITCIAKYS